MLKEQLIQENESLKHECEEAHKTIEELKVKTKTLDELKELNLQLQIENNSLKKINDMNNTTIKMQEDRILTYDCVFGLLKKDKENIYDTR